MGDGIQAAKAGILEGADVFVVNKADRDGADTVVRDLRYMLSLGDRRTDDGWRVPIVKTIASKGEGADEVVDEIEKHGEWLSRSGRLEERRIKRAADEVEAIALTSLRVDLRNGSLDKLAARVVAGELDPYSAADELVAGLDT
jgi:LAO/AO transport system kinase